MVRDQMGLVLIVIKINLWCKMNIHPAVVLLQIYNLSNQISWLWQLYQLCHLISAWLTGTVFMSRVCTFCVTTWMYVFVCMLHVLYVTVCWYVLRAQVNYANPEDISPAIGVLINYWPITGALFSAEQSNCVGPLHEWHSIICSSVNVRNGMYVLFSDWVWIGQHLFITWQPEGRNHSKWSKTLNTGFSHGYFRLIIKN